MDERTHTDELVRIVDSLQYRNNEGPRVHAATTREVTVSDHLSDDPRWPIWGLQAAQAGITAVLRVPLRSQHIRFGSMNLYRGGRGGYGHRDVQTGQLAVARVSALLAHQRVQRHLEKAIDARTIIGQALGMLTKRFHLTTDLRCPGFLGQWISLMYSEERCGEMARAKRSFSPEFREDAVKLVIDSSRPIAQVARELDVGEGTLGNWVNVYRREHAGEEPALDVSERARLREVERQLREVRMENEFLKKPPRTSPRITGEREVRVRGNHAHRARLPLSCAFDVGGWRSRSPGSTTGVAGLSRPPLTVGISSRG